jgi:hypothetical protein
MKLRRYERQHGRARTRCNLLWLTGMLNGARCAVKLQCGKTLFHWHRQPSPPFWWRNRQVRILQVHSRRRLRKHHFCNDQAHRTNTRAWRLARLKNRLEGVQGENCPTEDSVCSLGSVDMAGLCDRIQRVTERTEHVKDSYRLRISYIP